MQEKHITSKIKESYPFVDVIFGTHTLHRFPEDLYKALVELRKTRIVENSSLVANEKAWSLMDEENWNATHRFSGKLWMASGILCMLCGLFGESMAALVVYIISIMAAETKKNI